MANRIHFTENEFEPLRMRDGQPAHRAGGRGRALVIGAAGGVGHALLSVLANTDVGRAFARKFEEILLLDAVRPISGTLPPGARWLEPGRITSADELIRIVREHGVREVIDLSSLGTIDCVTACDAEGVSFLNSSVEHWPSQPPRAWEDLVLSVLPARRPRLVRASHLVGSGMNPGVVNALVERGIHAFARLVGVERSPRALGLTSILITEEDTTEELAAIPEDVFPMTWSPTHALEELLQPHTVFVRDGGIRALGHSPRAALYGARCGDRLIDGMIVPHEEVITLGERYSDVEIAFLYRIAPAARRALAAHPERVKVADWPVHRMYPPHATALRGSDRVGVLLGTHSFGELWIGYDVAAPEALDLGTSPTQLQVAAGVLAGWTQLGRVRGIHFVEDLDWREYLGVVDAVLGAPVVVHDSAALPRTIRDRRVGARPRPQLERGVDRRPAPFVSAGEHAPVA